MTTRFPNGLTTTKKDSPLGEFILPDMTTAHIYMEDFDYYNAANWIVTEVGLAAQALNNSDGGNLLITNAGADDNSAFLQKGGESYLFQVGKKLWFDCLIEVNEVIQSDVIIGLQIIDISPLSVTDGVYFIKNDGTATFDLVVVKGSSATTISSVATISNATPKRLSFFYDGVDKITIYDDGIAVTTSVTTNLPDDQTLTISFGVQNGEAGIKSLAVDYIMAAKER